MSDTMTELDLELEIKIDPEIPCLIEPPYSQDPCGENDKHAADVRVLASCGCVHPYCDSAVRWLEKGYVLCNDHRDRAFIIVAIEPLR